MQLILTESGEVKKYEKKYKCAYCDGRFTRQDLVNHIQKKHEDMIPEGYTPLRVAFNIVNNKTEGHCIIDEAVTAWNEIKGRYERLCGKKSCKDAYIKMTRKRIKDIYGTDCILKDPRYAAELQKKMLASRKISGQYKFSDGGVLGYTGTYEKKCLEFMDKIMHINSTDITSPGPIIYYKYKDDVHMYISDFLYIPYNLIIEVKDGGSNPNNRPMEEYREKQLAKEQAVRDDKEYNYLRLTDNDFAQLMEVMAILKYTLAEDPEQKIVKVNEMTDAITAAIAPNPLPYESDKDNYYIIQYMQNNVYNYSISKDPTQTEMIFVDSSKKNKVSKMNKKDLPESYITFKLRDQEEAAKLWNEAVDLLNMGASVNSTDYFYRKYRGINVLSDDQIFFDESCVLIKNFDQQLKEEYLELYDYLTRTKPIDLLESQISLLY